MVNILVLMFFSMEAPRRESLWLKEVDSEEGVRRFIGHECDANDDGPYAESMQRYFSRKNIPVQTLRATIPSSGLNLTSNADPATDTWDSPFMQISFTPTQESIQALADLMGMPVRAYVTRVPEPITELFRAEPRMTSAA